jgi:hypothetical protein
LEHELLCKACSDDRGAGALVQAAHVCEPCFNHATSEVCDLVGVRGAPGILEHAKPFDGILSSSELPTAFGTIVDIAPVDGIERSLWLILGGDGRLVRFDAETSDSTVVASSTLSRERGHEPFAGHALTPRLHVSSRGEFAAVVNDYGRYGQLVDLASGRVTLALDGGDYHPETVPFSFAFAEVQGRPLAIHRTAWNRLDASNPATGELVTERGPTRYERGGERSPHYLDYFHGALRVDPTGSHVLDDGWVWHPCGRPTTWNLQRWIVENPWESEDGASKLDICARDYYWDRAAVWIDATRVAVCGIGDDEEAMVDGVRVFDISWSGNPGPAWRQDWRVAHEVAAIPGPAGVFFSDGVQLFSSDATGLSRWDLATGARTGRIPAFQPTRHHRGAGELVQMVDNNLVRWRAH